MPVTSVPLREEASITAARFRLDASSSLPPVTLALPLAEAARRALLRECRRLAQLAQRADAAAPHDAYPAFWGKDALGRPLHGHAHAFLLPTDEDDDGRLDHLTLVAPMGFRPLERHALGRFHRLPWSENENESEGESEGEGENAGLRLLLLGLGEVAALRAPLFETAAVWVSATPFLATRYPKCRGRKRDQPEDYATPLVFARHVLAEELRRRTDWPAALSVQASDGLGVGVQRLRPMQFTRGRRKSGDDGERRPCGAFRITFAQPVAGPICVGHGCHFGLGLFLPAGSE